MKNTGLETHPFRFLRNLGRSREIATVLLNFGFVDLVERLQLRRYLQWGKRLVLRRTPQVEETHSSRAARVRVALESLGATFIKFGQVISTRADLLPPEVIVELSRLQEQVPPFDSDVARSMVEKQIGLPIEQIFVEFDDDPLAAGSLAQVHRARHQDGTLVAIKIRRPGVVETVERDLSLLFELAALLDRHIPESRIFDPVGLVTHFARTIRREMNFEREVRTMREFARQFEDDATLYVPRVYEDLSTDSVICMEFIHGARIDDPQNLVASGISPRTVATNGALIFMKQAFENGLFHGDPHPGNIRVMRDGSLCLLDYGMIGMLEDDMREALVDLFLSVVRRDVRSAVSVILVLGEPFRPVDESMLRADVREFVENYYGVTLERLRIGSMLNDFLRIISRHGIRIPGDLLLLIRALVTMEGTGRKLDPNFNLAEHLSPFIERVVRDRHSLRRFAGLMASESRTFLRLAHDIPLDLGKALEKLSKDELGVQLNHAGLDHLITDIDRSSNRLVISMVVSALIVASALIIRSDLRLLWLSGTVFALSSFLGMWLILGIFRSGRL